MADLRPEQTAEGWDAVADGYAEHVDPDLAGFAREALELLPVGAGDRVLDVACGSGALALQAARRGAAVTAVDFSKQQIHILQARAEEEGLDRLDARVMDGQALDLDGGSFDAAFSMFGIMLFPDRARGFAELRRVLRPGGRAAVSAWRDPSEIEWFVLFKEAIATALPDMPEPPQPPFVELADPERFEREMWEAGFADVEMHTVDHIQEVANVEAAWVKLAEANPVLPALFSKMGRDEVERVREAFFDLYAEGYGSGGAQFESRANIALGTERGDR